MSLIPRFIALAILVLPRAAEACDLDDCALSPAMHAISGQPVDTAPGFEWVHHDLALARDALRRGETARALSLAHSLDRSLRSQVASLRTALDQTALAAVHGALQLLVEKANGWPLAELPTTPQEIQG